MGKTYLYRVLGRDQYKVIRIDDKKKKGDKERFQEYVVDLGNIKGATCDCKSYHFRKRQCKHIRFIIEQLKDKGGILDFQHEGDYDRLFAQIKKKETKTI